MTKELFIHVDT